MTQVDPVIDLRFVMATMLAMHLLIVRNCFTHLVTLADSIYTVVPGLLN